MRAYIYCSYKNSPEGFCLGAITYNPDAVEDYIPAKDALNKCVVKAFDEGIIDKIYGLMPNTDKYIYLLRELKKRNALDSAEGEIDIYMNFAFEFDGYDEYRNFVGNFDSLSIEEATDACAQFIQPDRSVDTYALKIKAVEFNAFVKKMSAPSKLAVDTKKFFVEVLDSDPQEEKLQSIFGCEFENIGGNKYAYPVSQKKNPPNVGGTRNSGGNPISDFFSDLKRRMNH